MAGLTRRSFLATGGVLAGLLATGGICDALAAEQAFVRPPGAVAESQFLARCIRCQKCLSVCPSRTIQPLSVAQSVAGVSTPALDFSKSYCDFCTGTPSGTPRCAAVCPTGALAAPAGKPRLNATAVIDRANCVAWDWKGCTACVDECPQQAISLDGQQRPVVDAQACDGCGLCELICPTASLRSYSHGSAEGKGIVIAANEGGPQ